MGTILILIAACETFSDLNVTLSGSRRVELIELEIGKATKDGIVAISKTYGEMGYFFRIVIKNVLQESLEAGNVTVAEVFFIHETNDSGGGF